MRIRGTPVTLPENSSSSRVWQWCIDRESIRYQNGRTSNRSSAPSSHSSYSFESCKARCEGLDLLAEAVLHVVQNVLQCEQQQEQEKQEEQEESGKGDEHSTMMITGVSVFGVPFTKRSVTRRAKKAFRFIKVGDEIETLDEKRNTENIYEKERATRRIGFGLRSKRSRSQAIPLKFQDSVLQPWKRRTRRRLIDQASLNSVEE